MEVKKADLGKMISENRKWIIVLAIAITSLIGGLFIPNYFLVYFKYVAIFLFSPLLLLDLIAIRREDKANRTNKFWMSLLNVVVTIAILAVLFFATTN